MMQSNVVNNYKASKQPLRVKLKEKLLHWLRLTSHPVVKTYHGYGTSTHCMLLGHVLDLSPLPRKKYRQNVWTNSLALLRTFMVSAVPNKLVRIKWDNNYLEAHTADDGFFRFEWVPQKDLEPGIYNVEVELPDPRGNNYPLLACSNGSIIVSHVNQFAVISDIDDTFLVSHSSSLLKRLYVLFTKNAHSRKPFEGVVKHYQLLAYAGSEEGEANPFFYVSSSEWNLYNFILEFSRKNQLPNGVFLLSQLKNFMQVFKTGSNKHTTKFMRIVRVMDAYPIQKFILLGDDSQMDPMIYASVVEHFPGRILCVYLRHVYEKNITNVKELIEKIEAAGVPCCHFVHSKEAIEHSYGIGLINRLQ